MAARMLIIEDSPANNYYPLVNGSELCQTQDIPRYVFMTLLTVLSAFTVLGNLSALYVNVRRKLRPFFRACLLSVSCSDLLYCLVFTTSNMGLVASDYMEIWVLGSFMCYLVPFLNSTSVLCSSFTLVAIALDRYMAIRRAAVGIWNPGRAFCGLCIAGIWLASMVVALPLFFIYMPSSIYIKIEPDEIKQVTMCAGRKSTVGIYNSVALGLVFAPCIVAFIFLHVTIARKLWQRRHNHQQQKQHRLVHPLATRDANYAMMSAFSVAACFDAHVALWRLPSLWQPEKPSAAAVARVERHRRMVRVVLVMMGAFICLRLPAWVFLMMRVYGSFTSPVSWIFYFSFGLLNLTSCALNPLFYTFLPQTLRVLSQLKRLFYLLFCCGWASQLEPDAAMPQESLKQNRPGLCCGLQLTWRCQLKAQQAAAAAAEAKKTVAIIELPSTASCLSGQDLKDFDNNNGRSLQTTASLKSFR